MATRITVHASPLLLKRGVRGVTGQPLEIVVHLPTAPALSVTGFELGSAFPGERVLAALPELVRAAALRPKARLMLFGHGDEAGNPDGNKALGDRRAQAVLAFLIGDLARLDRVATEDRWALRESQSMMRTLGFALEVDGVPGPVTERATKRFQKLYKAGFYHAGSTRQRAYAELPCDGQLRPSTEAALRDAYHGLVRSHLPAERFFGPQCAGCGDFNRPCNGDQASRVTFVLYRPDFPTESRIPCREGDAASCKINKKAKHPWKCNFYRRTIEDETTVAGFASAPAVGSFASDFALKQTTDFAKQLTSGAFALWGRAVFGQDIPRAAFEQLHADLRAGAVANAQLRLVRNAGAHLGAYDSADRTVRISEDLIFAAQDGGIDASTLACILVEEFGHYLDDLLRRQYAKSSGDAPDDEGARFAYLLLSEVLAGPERFPIGTYWSEGIERIVEADLGEVKGILSDVLGPLQQQSDDRAGSLEFSDARPPDLPPQPQDAKEILYIQLLVAGSSTNEPDVLVDLARKLHARWRGVAGPPALFELSRPGKPGAALERVLLSTLLRLYRELDQRVQAAPLTADGLPDLGQPSWSLEPTNSLWEPNSPLAGVIEDISPFGEKQDWIARYSELDPERPTRTKRVRERWRAPPPSNDGGFDHRDISFARGSTPDLGPVVRGTPPDTTLDDALNTVDRGLGAADTVLSLLELVGIEVTGSFGIALAGPLLGIVTFLRGLLVVDQQQAEAAKGVGIVLAYFAIAAAARDPNGPPPKMTRARVEEEAKRNPYAINIKNDLIRHRGGTPEPVLHEGISSGIELVLDALNSNLELEASRAQRAYETMLLRARIERFDEQKLASTYTQAWWRAEVRRRTYEEFVGTIKKPALALFDRLSLSTPPKVKTQ